MTDQDDHFVARLLAEYRCYLDQGTGGRSREAILSGDMTARQRQLLILVLDHEESDRDIMGRIDLIQERARRAEGAPYR